MTSPLLPQEIAPVDARQADLTRRYLNVIAEPFHAFVMELRLAVDAELAAVLPPAGGKPYPYGRCEEINRAVFARLADRVGRPTGAIDVAIRAFIAEGGLVRSIWGVLRGQYFQNALQFGALYVDVSNDTVVVTKPKVEILPIADSGLVPVRDLDHFVATARIYWGAEVYANTLVPSLAPVLPMITASPGRLVPGFQSASDYMIALMIRDRFHQAEAWIAAAPSPPPAVAEAIAARIPSDLRPVTDDWRTEAAAACRAARASTPSEDGEWREARVRDYLRVVGARR